MGPPDQAEETYQTPETTHCPCHCAKHPLGHLLNRRSQSLPSVGVKYSTGVCSLSKYPHHQVILKKSKQFTLTHTVLKRPA